VRGVADWHSPRGPGGAPRPARVFPIQVPGRRNLVHEERRLRAVIHVKTRRSARVALRRPRFFLLHPPLAFGSSVTGGPQPPRFFVPFRFFSPPRHDSGLPPAAVFRRTTTFADSRARSNYDSGDTQGKKCSRCRSPTTGVVRKPRAEVLPGVPSIDGRRPIRARARSFVQGASDRFPEDGHRTGDHARQPGLGLPTAPGDRWQSARPARGLFVDRRGRRPPPARVIARSARLASSRGEPARFSGYFRLRLGHT